MVSKGLSCTRCPSTDFCKLWLFSCLVTFLLYTSYSVCSFPFEPWPLEPGAPFVQEEQDEVLRRQRSCPELFSRARHWTPSGFCCQMESNSVLHLQRGATCLLWEKTEAVGVLLCRHLQVPWVFPPAMTQRGSEDVSAWSRLRGILVLTVTFLFLPGIERVTSLA